MNMYFSDKIRKELEKQGFQIFKDIDIEIATNKENDNASFDYSLNNIYCIKGYPTKKELDRIIELGKIFFSTKQKIVKFKVWWNNQIIYGYAD